MKLKNLLERLLTPPVILAEIHNNYLHGKPPLTVKESFQLSYGKLDRNKEIDRLAIELLKRAIYFAHGEPIPRYLLRASANLSKKEFDPNIEKFFSDGIMRLSNLGLVNKTIEGDITLDRSLIPLINEIIVDSQAQKDVEQAILEESITWSTREGYPACLKGIEVQLRWSTNNALKRGDKIAGDLSNQLGHYLAHSGNYVEATFYLEQTLAVREKIFGINSPIIVNILSSLATVLIQRKKWALAKPYYERVLAINEEVLGFEHPKTIKSLANLGQLLKDMGELILAKAYFERALAINEQVLGVNHPTIASSLDNLGFVLKALGKLGQAKLFFERALAINEEVLGVNHPKTANSLTNLGCLLERMGNFEEAKNYYERALVIREKILGNQHPDTGNSLNRLGCLLEKMGNFDEAKNYYKRTLWVWNKLCLRHEIGVIETKIARIDQAKGIEEPSVVFVKEVLEKQLKKPIWNFEMIEYQKSVKEGIKFYRAEVKGMIDSQPINTSLLLEQTKYGWINKTEVAEV